MSMYNSVVVYIPGQAIRKVSNELALKEVRSNITSRLAAINDDLFSPEVKHAIDHVNHNNSSSISSTSSREKEDNTTSEKHSELSNEEFTSSNTNPDYNLKNNNYETHVINKDNNDFDYEMNWNIIRHEHPLTGILLMTVYLATSYVLNCSRETECVQSTIERTSRELFCDNQCVQKYTFPTATVKIGNSAEDVNSLRHITWEGCHPEWLRACTWRLLLGYVTPNVNQQYAAMRRKRVEYDQYVRQYYNRIDHNRTSVNKCKQKEEEMWEFFCNKFTKSDRVHVEETNCKHLPVRSYTNNITGEQECNSKSGQAEKLSSSSSSAQMCETSETLAKCEELVHTLSTTMSAHEKAIFNQISLDLPRHDSVIYQNETTMHSLRRCLFLWAQRHPAVGYVQGMDDIVGIFYHIFLCDALLECYALREYRNNVHNLSTIKQTKSNEINYHFGVLLHKLHKTQMNLTVMSSMSSDQFESIVTDLPESVLMSVEADTYWCAGIVLGQLQDNFTPSLPGIKRAMHKLESLAERSSPYMLSLLAEHGIMLMQGCFQWLHCLFIREMTLPLLARLWDTYFAFDKDLWSHFHLYVCASLLSTLERYIRKNFKQEAITSKVTPLSYHSNHIESEELTTEELLSLLREPMKSCNQHTIQSTNMTQSDANEKCQSIWLEMIIADAYRL